MALPLLAILAAAGAAGKIAGGAAKGSADQRNADNNRKLNQNQLLTQLYGTKQNASMNALLGGSNEQSAHANIDVARRRLALDAPGKRASQSVQGSILANAQPFKLSGLPDRVASRIPEMSGGLTPEMFSADTRALGSELSRTALIDQLRGDNFDPLQKTDFKSGILDDPKLEAYNNKAGLLEKILGGIGMVGSMAGAAGASFGAAGAAGNSGSVSDFANATPSPYSGFDRYGNASNFMLPRPGFNG